MRGLRNLLLQEQFRLENIIKEAKARLEQAPEGRLRLSKSHNHVQYYCCTKEKKSGDYIPKEELEVAKKLAQKSYDEKVLQLANVRLTQIKKLTSDYADDELEKIYLKEHTERKKLIRPIEPTWEQQLEEWISRKYKGKDFQKETPVILTEKGERVRSKSEKIMSAIFERDGNCLSGFYISF